MTRIANLATSNYTDTAPMDRAQTYGVVENPGGTARATLESLGLDQAQMSDFGGIEGDSSSAARTKNVDALQSAFNGFGRYLRIHGIYYLNNGFRMQDSRQWLEFTPGSAIISNHTGNTPVIWMTQELGKAGTGNEAKFCAITGMGRISADGNRPTQGPGEMVAGLTDGARGGLFIGRDYRDPDDTSVNNVDNPDPTKPDIIVGYRGGEAPLNTSDPNLWNNVSHPHFFVDGLIIEKQPGSLFWGMGLEQATLRRMWLRDGGYRGFVLDGGLSYIGTGSRLGRATSGGITNLAHNIHVNRVRAGAFYHDDTNQWSYQGVSASEWSYPVAGVGVSVANEPGFHMRSSHNISMRIFRAENGPEAVTGNAKYGLVVDGENPYTTRGQTGIYEGGYFNNCQAGMLIRNTQDNIVRALQWGPDRLDADRFVADGSNQYLEIQGIPQHDGQLYRVTDNPSACYWHYRGGDTYLP